MRDKTKTQRSPKRVSREHEALIYALFGAKAISAAKDFNKEKDKNGKPV